MANLTSKWTFKEEAREAIEIGSDLHDNQRRMEEFLLRFFKWAYGLGFEDGGKDEQ